MPGPSPNSGGGFTAFPRPSGRSEEITPLLFALGTDRSWDLNWCRSLVRSLSLKLIGIVSYEWFLFHQPVVYLFQDIFGQTRGNAIFYVFKTFLPLALTFGLSVVVYRYFFAATNESNSRQKQAWNEAINGTHIGIRLRKCSRSGSRQEGSLALISLSVHCERENGRRSRFAN